MCYRMPLTAAEAGREAGDIVAAMASIIFCRLKDNGVCSWDDLIRDGFDRAELAEHRPEAERRARARLAALDHRWAMWLAATEGRSVA